MNERPTVSVIVPARNEEHYLAATIKSIKKQRCDFTYEIIVVDNGSIDDTAKVARDASAQVVTEPVAGLPRAREAGRRAARGKYLVYVDADTTIPPSYLETVVQALTRSDRIVAVSNPFRFSDGTRGQDLLIYLYFRLVYPCQAMILRLIGRSRQVIGGSFIVRADALERVGGFNTELEFFGEDTELSKRLGRIGVISFIYDIQSSTSARRFQVNGNIQTSYVYVKNYFAMVFFNRAANSDFWRTSLKVLAILVSGLIVRRAWIDLTIDTRVRHFGHEHMHLVVLSTILLVILLILLYGLISPRSQLFGKIINRLNTTEKLVALSFDDGPTKAATRQVLDILAAAAVPATFFMIGDRMEAEPELAQAVHRAGHDIGYHTLHHTWLLPFRTKQVIRTNIRASQRVAEEVLGQPDVLVPLFRPPHGWRTPWMLQAVAQAGLVPIFWWVMTLDYRERTSTRYIVKRVIKRTKPGTIIVLHDGIAEDPKAQRDHMLEALPVIIKTLQAQGYRFVLLKDVL